MTLFLLCAGEGTRLRPYTLTLPKPAIPFLGVPLAGYSLEWAKEIAPKKVLLNTFHLPEKVHALAPKLVNSPSAIKFSDEAPELLGSGGALMKQQARLALEENFLLMNGDEVFLPEREGFLREALAKHIAEDRLATLLVMEHAEVGKQFGGVWVDDQNRVLGFGKTPLSAKGWHYIGAVILSRRILSHLPRKGASNILYDGVATAIAAGERIGTQEVRGFWRETGNPTDFLSATGEALHRLSRPDHANDFLRRLLDSYHAGWRLEANAGDPVLFLPGSTADRGCIFTGFAVIGARTELGRHCEIENGVIGDHLKIRADSSIKNILVLQQPD